MTVSAELFTSILAMDSYNRGYDSGIGDANLGLGENGQIGTATILNPLSLGGSQSVLDNWQDAGFYASAYTLTAAVGNLSAGTIVVSYRGTDNYAELDGNDVLNGWITGAGATSGQIEFAGEGRHILHHKRN